MLCDALDQLGRPDGTSSYLRLSTRPIDQAPFANVLAMMGEERLRSQVLAGGYRLVDTSGNVFALGATRSQTRIATSTVLVAAG